MFNHIVCVKNLKFYREHIIHIAQENEPNPNYVPTVLAYIDIKPHVNDIVFF